ncbi:hypothetical protein SADUNF_Sadunf04G0092900 [Salix dunnii]|uniref:Uncharacterized protein n=1 Tax=Salix dunnii TaxID=1413687 RepID=A0A835K4R2_9ROSI|nr:hypothetical protein SADUNF_Sadunf04G0092900 [Salix dunnii]
MASSSHKIHNGYDFSRPLEGGEEDREWLQLGLGISRITTPATCRRQENNIEQSKYVVPGSAVSSSLLHFQAHQQIGHSLGLELGLGSVGLDDNGGSGGVRRDKEVAPISNYYHKSSMCQDNQGQEDHDYNLDLTARLSSPSWPSHMISSSSTSFPGWKMPVSNVSHNCSSLPAPPLFSPTTTRPHLVGLWFTLSSTINREGAALPQIPKAYIRVKDENVTVFMVKKYLVRKLGLSNEDEVISFSFSLLAILLVRRQVLAPFHSLACSSIFTELLISDIITMDVIIDTRVLKFVIRDDRRVHVKFTETILDSRLALSTYFELHSIRSCLVVSSLQSFETILQIEISCMGQKLMHAQTLKQVRDAIWLPGLVDSVNSTTLSLENSLINGSIYHQLMSLQYHVPCGV